MVTKRQLEQPGDEHRQLGGAHSHREPGQPGYPKAQALEKLRRLQVAKVRKLSRQ